MPYSREHSENRPLPWWVTYGITAVSEVIFTVGLNMLAPVFPIDQFVFPYILIVMVVGYLFGDGQAILAFILGFICYAYYVPPHEGLLSLTGTIDDRLILARYLIGAVIAGAAASAVRRSKEQARMLSYRYRSLIETMNEGFATNDENYTFTYANPRFAEMLGYEPDEIVGHNFLEFVDESNRAFMNEQIAQRREGKFGRYELAWKTKDGRTIYTLVSPKPTFDDNGKFLGSHGAVTDITDRKHAEQALADSERKYRELFQKANDAIFLVSVTDDNMPELFLDVNDVACKMLGYTREELLKLGPKDINDPESVKNIPATMQELLVSGSSTFEITQISKSGAHIPVELSTHLFETEGKKRILAISRDISERKQAEENLRKSEERFRALFERAADSLFLHDLNGRFVEVNQATCDYLGYTREELLELSVPDIVVDANVDFHSIWHELMVSGPMTVTVTHRRKDGTHVLVEGRLSMLEYSGQSLILAVVRDITERQRAEEERFALEKHLDDQKRFFYRETILSVTDGKLEIADEGDLEPYLANSDVSIEVCNPSEIADARREAKAFCWTHGLFGERLDSFMLGVGEAITNAVKHGGKGTVHAGVKGEFVWVGVKDNGPGIESLILPRVTLLRGFSTKTSMGLGYCIMLEVADRIHLKTDVNGTVVILEKGVSGLSGKPSLADLPDTWDSIPS